MIRRMHSAAAVRRVALGFTLIEIALVISIIGVLSATAGARYLHMLERARTARAIVELRGIAVELDPMGDDGHEYPDTLAEIGISLKDPWGRPYRYLKLAGELPSGVTAIESELPAVAAPPVGGPSVLGSARKDRFLVPINSDYDLYSVGPDGKTHPNLNDKVSRDDIIRAADGTFYGVAEKF